MPLPVGLDYDEDGQVGHVRGRGGPRGDRRIFRRFAELGSARQVMLSLLDDGLLLPRRSPGVPAGSPG